MKEQVIVTSQEEQDFVCKNLNYEDILNTKMHNFEGVCRFIPLDKNCYNSRPYKGYKTISFDEFKSRREPEVWKPKQGDKVLVSNDNEIWCERVFVLEYKTLHYCELPSSHNDLIQWKYIKPYKEKIKVGDWVIFKVEEKDKDMIKNLNKNKHTKITNPQLIELLEKSINE